MVHKSSSCHTVEDLDVGSTVLAYNDTQSLSGFHCAALFVDKLLSDGKLTITPSKNVFRELRRTGGHVNSVKALTDGLADVCALDCCVWSHLRRTKPTLLRSLRPLKGGLLGPHPVQPVVASKRLSPELCKRITAAFVSLNQQVLAGLHVSHYAVVTDSHYAPIRQQLSKSVCVKRMLSQIADSDTFESTPSAAADADVTKDSEDRE